MQSNPVMDNATLVLPVESNGKGINSIDSTYSYWEAPIIPGQLQAPEIPTTVLPVWLGEYADAISKNTQTPQGLSVLMGLSVVSACVQKRFEVCPLKDDYREPLSIWTATGMPPASRKTAVTSGLTWPLNEWEQEQHNQMQSEIADVETKRAVNLKTIERLQNEAGKENDSVQRLGLIHDINKLKEETPEEVLPPRTWTSDVTPERLQGMLAEYGERMAVISDEGGIFEIMGGLYSDGKANLDVFLQSHAGKSIRVDRGKRTAYLNKPALAFGLAVQPEVFSDLGRGNKKRFRGIGALARFLYHIPKSNIGLRDIASRQLIPATVKQSYRNGIFNLLNIPPLLDEEGIETPRILHLSQGALDAWLIFSQFIESKQGKGEELEPIQDWSGKLAGAALRIAGLCHVAEFGETSLEISKETMEKAQDLCELLIPHAQIAFDMMGGDQSTDDAKIIAQWIIDNGELSFKRSDCHATHHGRFKKLERLLKALEVLQGWNVIGEVDPVRVEGVGRPALIYHVNPAVLKGDE